MNRLPLRSLGVALWLWFVAAMVILMILVGGATRLTDSGLSITKWEPISGVIPPLSDGDWQKEFDAYKKIPEYKIINYDMTIEGFKTIYWWEWAHRLLGRLIGLAFVLPMLWFFLKGDIPQRIQPRLWGLLALGGLQGFVGWWMVKSGLSDRVDVAAERLMTHLSLALILLVLLVWTGLESLNGKSRGRSSDPLWPLASSVLLGWIIVQSLLGALVAGNDAGLVYTDWPLMNGYFFPALSLDKGLYALIFHDQGMVQLMHRLSAYGLLAYGFWFLMAVNKHCLDDTIVKGVRVMTVVLVLQAILGIATLQTGVNTHLALSHQFLGVVLLVLATITLWMMRRSDRAFR
jgi:cytochrome c oxidase assembly protein subunit 15